MISSINHRMIIDCRSNTGQTLVKRWSNAGQTRADCVVSPAELHARASSPLTSPAEPRSVHRFSCRIDPAQSLIFAESFSRYSIIRIGAALNWWVGGCIRCPWFDHWSNQWSNQSAEDRENAGRATNCLHRSINHLINLLMCGLNQFIDFLISVFHLLQKIA
jgi:hypothetical protein